MTAQALTSRTATAPPRARGRGLGAHLLPRPEDLGSAVAVPLGFVVGLAAGGIGQVGHAVLVWLALELLVHPARRARPAVAALRLALTAALALAVPHVAGVLLGATAGVLGAAAVHARVRPPATGPADGVPVPLRPALVALWVVVGAGCAVRGLTGLALAVDLGARPGLAVSAGLAAWALGVVVVTSRWALEPLRLAAFRDGQVVWHVAPGQAREHTLGLVGWLPAEAPADSSGGPCAWRALQDRAGLTAPWDLALLVAGGAAGLTGHLLAGSGAATTGLAALVVGAGTAAAVALLPAARVPVAVAGVLLLVAVQVTSGDGAAPVAALPLALVLVVHRAVVRQCAGVPLRRPRSARPPR